MPAKDIYHDQVKNALIKDGWTITHDPLTLKTGRNLYVDLGAEKLIAAEKENRKIAVEVKSFVGRSEMRDLEQALGQFVFYQEILAFETPERTLWLAITYKAFKAVFEELPGRLLLDNKRLRIIVFDAERAEVKEWIT